MAKAHDHDENAKMSAVLRYVVRKNESETLRIQRRLTGKIEMTAGDTTAYLIPPRAAAVRRYQAIVWIAGFDEEASGAARRSRFVRMSRFTILYLSPR